MNKLNLLNLEVPPQEESMDFVGSETVKEFFHSCPSQSVILCYPSILSPADLPDSSVLQAEPERWLWETLQSGALQPVEPLCTWSDQENTLVNCDYTAVAHELFLTAFAVISCTVTSLLNHRRDKTRGTERERAVYTHGSDPESDGSGSLGTWEPNGDYRHLLDNIFMQLLYNQ